MTTSASGTAAIIRARAAWIWRRRIAGENGVTIVPDPPLARSLHASVEIDQMIPAELYAAVAQVLAFVYRTAAARRKVAA